MLLNVSTANTCPPPDPYRLTLWTLPVALPDLLPLHASPAPAKKYDCFQIHTFLTAVMAGTPANPCLPHCSDFENFLPPNSSLATSLGSCTGRYPVSGSSLRSARAPRLPHGPHLPVRHSGYKAPCFSVCVVLPVRIQVAFNV